MTVSADIDAPKDGRPATRVNWLLRQLGDAPEGLRVDAFSSGSRSSRSDLLRAVRETPSLLIDDPRRELSRFRIAASSPLGTKRGTGRGGFIDSVLASVDGFYGAVIQQLRPWTPKAPQLPSSGRTAAEEAGIDTSAPPKDLLEDDERADIAPLGPETPDTPAPEVVNLGVAAAEPTAATPPGAEATPGGEAQDGRTDELVSWDASHQRLDHERNLETGPVS